MVAAVAAMVKDADKLNIGLNLSASTSHVINSSIKQPPDRWLTNARMAQYQSLLLNPKWITFTAPTAFNPASLLLDPDLELPCMIARKYLLKNAVGGRT